MSPNFLTTVAVLILACITLGAQDSKQKESPMPTETPRLKDADADEDEDVKDSSAGLPDPYEKNREDSSAGLPDAYAKNYLIARSTISPDKKFAVIYPNEANELSSKEDEKDYLIRLEPYSVLGALDTSEPYFEHESNGGISADWSGDSSVAVVTLDGRWGPKDVLLLELADGKLKRTIKLLSKVSKLLYPNLRKHKPLIYIESLFVFTDFEVSFQDTKFVSVSARATTCPGLREPPDLRVWDGEVEAIWDIRQAKFTSKKVSGQMRKKSEDTLD
jgi:hypothetical protein